MYNILKFVNTIKYKFIGGAFFMITGFALGYLACFAVACAVVIL